MLTPYQIFVPFIALIAILYAWNLTVKQKKSIWESLLWTIFWAVVAIISLFPELLNYLTALTGIKSQVNAILLTGLGIVFFMVFYIIIRLEQMEQRQTRVIRSLGLRDANLKRKK